MHTWKITAQDDCSDVEEAIPIMGNMETYVKADTIEEAIKIFYSWYTLGKAFIVEAKLV